MLFPLRSIGFLQGIIFRCRDYSSLQCFRANLCVHAPAAAVELLEPRVFDASTFPSRRAATSAYTVSHFKCITCAAVSFCTSINRLLYKTAAAPAQLADAALAALIRLSRELSTS